MIVAIHQPQYLPWLPYCAKAAQCDLFVYLDTVQFQKNGVQNRNQVKSAQGPRWLTVPVHASLGDTLQRIRIAPQDWRKKHIQTVTQNYSRAEFHDLFDQELRNILERPWEYLVDLNIAATEWLFTHLSVTSRRVRASTLGADGTKDDLVIDICEKVGADGYLSGHGAKAYQDESKFQARGITLHYQTFESHSYRQCYPEQGFVPDLSALDLLLNEGPAAGARMISGGRKGRDAAPVELNRE